MLVTCPNCQTTFNIPDAAYKPGRKARCSNCGFVFLLPELPDAEEKDDIAAVSRVAPVPETQSTVSGPGAVAPEEDASHVPGYGKSFEDIIADAVENSEDRPAAPEDMHAEGEETGSAAPVTTASALPAAGSSVTKSPPPRKKRRRVLFAFLIVLLCLCLGIAGFLAYSAFFSPPAQEEKKAQETVHGISDMELSDMRQYVVNNNEKIRRLVVVEGNVTNLSKATRELVIIEASLFDKFGNTLAIQQQYCGVTLSQFQLQVFGKEEIVSALSNEREILMNNANIVPGSSVPCMTVFFDPPPASYEFIVRIVDAKDAAPAAGGGSH